VVHDEDNANYESAFLQWPIRRLMAPATEEDQIVHRFVPALAPLDDVMGIQPASPAAPRDFAPTARSGEQLGAQVSGCRSAPPSNLTLPSERRLADHLTRLSIEEHDRLVMQLHSSVLHSSR
jgi:hypothetical protein